MKDYQQYVVVEKASLTGGLAAYKVLPEDSKLPWSAFLGAAGMAGMLYRISRVVLSMFLMHWIYHRANRLRWLERVCQSQKGTSSHLLYELLY